MTVNKGELFGLFENIYDEESAAEDLKKRLRGDLKEFAEEHGLTTKVVNCAYAMFKKYRSGKQEDSDEMNELTTMVEDYFKI